MTDYSYSHGFNSRISITFGDQGEIGVGMSKVGQECERGLTVEELKSAGKNFIDAGASVEYYDLNVLGLGSNANKCAPAGLLVVRRGIDVMLQPYKLTADNMYMEQVGLTPCKHVYNARRKTKKVQNRRKRWNTVFAFHDDTGDLHLGDDSTGRGPVINFSHVPITGAIQALIPNYFGSLTKGLVAEGNIYFESNSHIGYHGDKERKIVVCVRLGGPMKLSYVFYQNHKPISAPIILELNHGDIYAMSEKAVGQDWMHTKDNLITLRHAAAMDEKILTPKVK